MFIDKNQILHDPSIGISVQGKDPWKNRSNGMRCQTCVFYVPKKSSSECTTEIGRCRRNAPTLKGFPAVFPNDWCGEHRIDEEKLLCG